MSNYTIQKLESDQFHLLIPLMKDCFGMDVNIDYFQWKFLNNPAGEFVGFIAVADNGDVAAYYGVFPEYYIINGQKKTIFQSGDTMTHSKHRRKGLFYKTANHCYNFLKENGHVFVIGFGGKESTPGLEKLEWKHLFKISFFFKSYYVSKINNAIRCSKSKEEITIKEDCCPEDIIKLREKTQDKINVLKAVNIDLLKWKLANPLFDFKKIGIYDNDGDLGAYIIYCIQNNKILIYDFAEKKVRSKALKNLFRYIDKIVVKNKFKGVFSFTNERSGFARALKYNGFMVNNFGFGPLNEKIPFMVYTDDENYKSVENSHDWNVDPIYHDSL